MVVMLQILDSSIAAFLRAAVPLSVHDVDIVFEAPDRDWEAARPQRPTVNLFLWDVRRNLAEQDAGVHLRKGENGHATRRPPLPRMDCRYLVTAWTSDVEHEHKLLGDVLRALLVQPHLPPEHLGAGYADVRPLPTLRVAMPDGKDTADFWSALGGRLKPGLDLVVTATVDAVPVREAGAPVGEFDLGLKSTGGPFTGGEDKRTWGPHQDGFEEH
jgi:Pvc16 N-terminal domain